MNPNDSQLAGSALGAVTSYPKTYSPQVLYPIARQLGRDEIARQTGSSVIGDQGVDVWQIFELSWLNRIGVSQVATARLFIPAHSPNIVESKSLKLYLNGLNFTVFDSMAVLKETIACDIAECVQCEIVLDIYDLNDETLMINKPVGECIDQALDGSDEMIPLSDEIDSSYLSQAVIGEPRVYQFYSHLLRSNCPVTNQPDWGTLMVDIHTDRALNFAQILRYILSFRQHNGFHEQCVERIFVDFMHFFAPTSLCVQANYTRRGGIDINPIRVFQTNKYQTKRLVRQ